jgi:rhamnogalacturonyl hydrolase YesR
MDKTEIKNIALNLYLYAKDRDFSGWDPYDGLTSRLFQASPLNRIRLCRLAWIQFFKRCPINLRPIFLVPKGRNPKGIALFASSALNLYKCTGDDKYLADAKNLFQWLEKNHSKWYSGHAWGYNFSWQSKHFLFPAFSPTIVSTSFVGLSFLDGYDVIGDKSFVDVAASAAKFILNDFQIHREGTATAFGYGPKDKSAVYNATALGGQLFARLYKATGENSYLNAAINALDFVVSRQQKDGSWLYGDHPSQNWIDNFHTGFNLIALKKFQEYTNDKRYNNSIVKGFEFYKKELFTGQGAPKYFSHSFYPIDVHACAESILMFVEFNMPERAKEVAEWTVKMLWNKRGYFDYQITKLFRTSIPYMRWSEAWMEYALSAFLVHEQKNIGL